MVTSEKRIIDSVVDGVSYPFTFVDNPLQLKVGDLALMGICFKEDGSFSQQMLTCMNPIDETALDAVAKDFTVGNYGFYPIKVININGRDIETLLLKENRMIIQSVEENGAIAYREAGQLQ